MVNYVFWSTMAGVSGVFMGFVFIGLSLCQTNIQRAISEVKAELADPDTEEQSSRLMFVLVLSNLTFVVLPLIVSLNLIAQSRLNTPVPFWISMSICLLLLPVLLLGHENEKTRQQVKSALSVDIGRSKKLLLQCRFKGVKVLLYLAVPTHAVFLSAILVGWPPIPGPEDWLKGVVIFSVVAGLSCGIADLTIFDANNISFRMSDKFRGHLEDRFRYLEEVKIEVKSLYQEYETAKQSLEYKRLLEHEDSYQKKEREQQDHVIYSTYKRMCQNITSALKSKYILQFIKEGENIPRTEIKLLKEQKKKLELLFQEAESFKKLLEGKLTAWRAKKESIMRRQTESRSG